MTTRAFFEIGPLFERHWTGIPAVTAGIAEQALDDASIDWRFFYHTLELPRDFVADLLARRSGLDALEFVAGQVWEGRDIDFEDVRAYRALFPNIKTVRGVFGEEAIFVHDLSPLLTPQFHHQDSINHFADRFRHDIDTSVRFFCNSEATRGDLVTYFGVDPAAAPVVPMGARLDLGALSRAQLAAQLHTIEPYVVILGTLEPRKNGALVLRFLSRDPGFARRFRIVFVGREGWLDENKRLLREIENAGLPRERIVFTGYIGETEKTALLYNAAFCVYASLFEGYGLPILEAAAMGKLIVCSDSSSMPEVAPERCIFFDPTEPAQFAAAMAAAERRAPQMRSPSSLIEAAARLDALGWERCYRPIAEWVKS